MHWRESSLLSPAGIARRTRGRSSRTSLTRVRGIETALVIPVPEAEPVVGSWRSQHASDAANGMWAHVTLISPFRDTSVLSDEVAHTVAGVLANLRGFPFTLATVRYFLRPRLVLYLHPEPAAPFEYLIRALTAKFPDTPPYRGAFDDVVPHLSVADEQDADLLAVIETAVTPHLPIDATAREVQLVASTPDGWRLRQTFDLAT
jgi:hypothetical protein